jgi:hypothetical protein
MEVRWTHDIADAVFAEWSHVGKAEKHCRAEGAHRDTAPSSNGAATSSLPSLAFSQGDEDIATPFPFLNGGTVQMGRAEGFWNGQRFFVTAKRGLRKRRCRNTHFA